MKIILPIFSVTAGYANPCELSFTAGRVRNARRTIGFAAFLSLGKPYLAGLVSARTFEKDFRVAERLRALAGIFALAVAFVFACLVPVPLYLLGRLAGRLSNVAEFIADKIVKPFVEFTVPLPVYGIRNTFKNLFRVVTR